MGSFGEVFGDTAPTSKGRAAEQRQRQRSTAALVRQATWARANLPSLPESLVMSCYEVLRYHLGREPSRREVDGRVREQWGEWLEVAA